MILLMDDAESLLAPARVPPLPPFFLRTLHNSALSLWQQLRLILEPRPRFLAWSIALVTLQ